MKQSINTVVVITFFLVILGCAATIPVTPVTAATPAETAIDRWADNHPQAASELGNWVKNHPQAAHKFFEWDGSHPERCRIFVTWAITHPAEGINAFASQHPRWQFFDEVMEHHRPAAQTFIQWCRRHPKAAEALMRHPRGLQWAGNHLYKSYWEMKNS